MCSRAAIRGKFFASCIPEGASDGKSAPPWQRIAAVYPKRAGFGKICAPCIRKALQIAFRECMARRSCQGGALFAALAPQIMHGAKILPRFSARKVLRAEGWRRWVVASALWIEADGPHVRTRPRPTAPHPVTKPRTGGPCTPVVATAFGERTVRRRVCFPELRLPAAASTVGASWQAPALWRVPFRNCPRSRGMPGPVTARLAADVAASGRCGHVYLAELCAYGIRSQRPRALELHAPPRSSPRCRHFSAFVPHGAVRPRAAACPMAHPAPQQLPVLLWSAATSLDAAHKKATS